MNEMPAYACLGAWPNFMNESRITSTNMCQCVLEHVDEPEPNVFYVLISNLHAEKTRFFLRMTN